MQPTYSTVDGKIHESPFLNFLFENKNSIHQTIFTYIPNSESLQPMKYGLDDHWRIIVDYPERGGKYVRPGLLLLSCVGCDGNKKEAMITAAAMEISEDWLLIHDDFEDKSLERRGKPTLHILHGEEIAVNAGDHLHLVMWKILMSNFNIMSSEKALKIAELMEILLQKTCEGQFLELTWTRNGSIINEEEYYEMVDRKTGWYTIIGPLQLGALIADQPDAFPILEEFGRNLGRAFQIHDDWLNVFSANTGKELGGDILEGKRTLLLINLIEQLKMADDRQNLDYIHVLYSTPREKKNQQDVEKVISLFLKYGCKEWVREQAVMYSEVALGLLGQLPYTNDVKLTLTDAVNFIINRQL